MKYVSITLLALILLVSPSQAEPPVLQGLFTGRSGIQSYGTPLLIDPDGVPRPYYGNYGTGTLPRPIQVPSSQPGHLFQGTTPIPPPGTSINTYLNEPFPSSDDTTSGMMLDDTTYVELLENDETISALLIDTETDEVIGVLTNDGDVISISHYEAD